MPNASEEARPGDAIRLERFLGEWIVTGTLTAEGHPAVVTGRWRFAQAADGWGVRGDLQTEIEGMGAFAESELIGFDAASGQVHLFSMNKFAIRDHVGGWIDETTLEVVYQGVQDGKAIVERIAIDFANPDDARGRVVETADGVVTVTTELVLSKRR